MREMKRAILTPSILSVMVPLKRLLKVKRIIKIDEEGSKDAAKYNQKQLRPVIIQQRKRSYQEASYLFFTILPVGHLRTTV